MLKLVLKTNTKDYYIGQREGKKFIVGNFKFLQTETFIRKNYSCENEQDFPSSIIKYSKKI